jgi:hypothetical protein
MSGQRTTRLAVWGALVLAIGLGFFFRVYHLDNKFWNCEALTVMTGLRLHTLPFSNVSDHASLNFFKALFTEIGGMRHILSVFVSSGLYQILGVPVTEFWLLFPYALLGTLTIVLVFWLGRALGDPRAGVVAAVLFAFSEPVIQSHRTDNAEATVTFLVAVSFVLLMRYRTHPTLPRALALGLVLAAMTCMETIALLPLMFLLLAVAVTDAARTSGARLGQLLTFLRSARGIATWSPSAAILGAHFYIYTRVGVSGLGLFGYMGRQYGDGQITILDRLSGIIGVNRQYASYYFSPWIYWATLAAFLLLMIRTRFRGRSPLMRVSALAFFYVMLVFAAVPSSWSAGMVHLYTCDVPNLLFFSAVWCAVIEWMATSLPLSRHPTAGRRVAFAAIGILLVWAGAAQADRTLREPVMVNSLKAVGFYLHEYGNRQATVYNLWSCRGRCMDSLSEYYYGKLVMNTPWSEKFTRQSFCRGTATVEATLARYGLQDFDFYVNLREVPLEDRSGGPSRMPGRTSRVYGTDDVAAELVARLGLRRVSSITYRGRILAEIYSRRAYPIRDLDVTTAGRAWDVKYARISDIVTSPWVGLCSFWGYRFDEFTGL